MNKIILVLIIIFIYNLIMIIKKIKESELKIPKKIKIFNLGSSHGEFSFKYTDYERGCNLARSSQTLYYDLKTLKNYYEKIEEKGICFIPISYFSFSERKYWLKEDKIRYYRTLKRDLIDKEDKKEAILYKFLPLYISIKKKFQKKKKIKEGEERIKGHVKLLENNNKGVAISWLKEIIKLLKNKETRIILITTPLRKEYNNFFPEELLKKEFYNNIEGIKEKYKLEYYDFSHRYDIFSKEEYFNDYDHLSKKGSEIFMQEIKKIINKGATD